MGLITSTLARLFPKPQPATKEISHPYPLTPKITSPIQSPMSVHPHHRHHDTTGRGRTSFSPPTRQGTLDALIPLHPNTGPRSQPSPESGLTTMTMGSERRKLRKQQKVEGGWELWREGDWRGFNLDEIRYATPRTVIGVREGSGDTMVSETSLKEVNEG